MSIGSLEKLACLLLVLWFLHGCAWDLKATNAIDEGVIKVSISKGSVMGTLGKGSLLGLVQLETGEILEVRLYKDWIWAGFLYGEYNYWVAFVNEAVAGYGSIGNRVPSAFRKTDADSIAERNNNLIFICGSSGMGVDFVTSNCTRTDGNQVNPYNLYPPFMAPLPSPSPADSIMRCQGRAVDFVTGRCM